MRKIEKFSFTYFLADMLILLTVIVIFVYASLHVKDHGWGQEVPLFNSSTWLTMIGSAVTSFEGIGVVIPLLEVTEKPELFPRILTLVMLTVLIMYSIFGVFNLFVYGDLLNDTPLITSLLDQGWVVYVIKICFAINVIFTQTLMIFPANIILEQYLFRGMPKSRKRQWLKNLTRTILFVLATIACLALGDKLDKFLSLVGSAAATPISFTIPCFYHYALCKPTTRGKVIDISIIVLSFVILIFCSGFNIWTWND